MAEGGAVLRQGGPTDAPIAASLHAAGFAGRERSWSAGEFDALLEIPGSFLFIAAPAPGAAEAAMLLGRAHGGEAELLTLATAAEARRGGLARALLACFAKQAAAQGAAMAFLEVAQDNTPARQLYSMAGWQEVGQRKAYFKRLSGARVDAVVMRLMLD